MKANVCPWTEGMRRKMGGDGAEEWNREGRDVGLMPVGGRKMGAQFSRT